jgi:hypothetical protein
MKKMRQQTRIWQKFLLHVPIEGGGFIESMSPEISKESPYSLADTEKVVRPVMEYGGMTAGGMVGAGSPVPGGALIGAGLGYASGKQGADLLYGKSQGTVGEELLESAVDVSQGAAMEMGGGIVGKLVEGVGIPTAKMVHSTVKRGMEKAIRPGVAKQRTAAQARKYYKQATDAVTNIVLNKNNLNLMDDAGKPVKGLPKTLKHFSDAIEQTKKVLFKEYDELAKAATGRGARVRLESGADELLALADSAPLQDMAPKTVKYALEKAEALLRRGAYTATEAQEAIQILNKSLEAFYKNPSFENATRAGVDALVVNHLRKSLEKTINRFTGQQYQKLKNAYGSLKAIEKDVGHRAAIDARKNIKGLIDYSGIFSGAEMAAGLVSMNPTFLARGVTAKAIASFYKYINNPNRIVKSMFSDTEKMLEKMAVSKTITSSATGRAMGRTMGYGVKQQLGNQQ